MAQWLTNQLVTMRLHIRSLALLSGSRIQITVAVVQGITIAAIRPLAWELPYATCVALQKKKKKEEKNKNQRPKHTHKKTLCHIQNICHVISTMDYLMTDEK